MDIIEKIKQCDTIPKLDDLRREIVRYISENGNGKQIQRVFIKQMNKLKRVPLKDREGWYN